MRALSPAESRALDERTIAAGTPGLTLMERAAAAITREIARLLARRPERGERVVLLAGTGNNGGDGFEVGSHLLRRGVLLETLVVGDVRKLTPDAATTYQRLEDAGGVPRLVTSERDLEALRSASLVIDALFGTGLARPLSGLAARAASIAGHGGGFVVAVDIPSGLDGGQGAIPGSHVVASLTVTFGHPKLAHVVLPAAGVCGRIVVADIGLLPLSREEGQGPEAVCAADIAPLFPHRVAEAHKGSFGRVRVVGGSDGMAGAPALAARAAFRSGAGLVTVAAPSNVRSIVHTLVPEATTAPIEGDFGPADALAVGPGLGTSEAARGVLGRALASPLPLVVDADGLNLMAGNPEGFAGRDAATVLTPHPGEAGRLLGIDAPRVNSDRASVARELASRSGSVVVLKGFRSVVARPEGETAIVLAGNPGMATGGAGDVLTGLVGAFLARGFSAWDAARAAAWLHGTAGDLAREDVGEEALIAGDLVESLPGAFTVVRESRLS